MQVCAMVQASVRRQGLIWAHKQLWGPGRRHVLLWLLSLPEQTQEMEMKEVRSMVCKCTAGGATLGSWTATGTEAWAGCWCGSWAPEGWVGREHGGT